MMLVYLVMLLCAVSIGLFVRRYDRYEREPGWMLLAAASGGFAMMAAAGRVEDALLSAMASAFDQPAARALLVATVEEAAKLATLAVVFVAARRHFNDPLDGVIYGTFIGLGAAVNESLLYLRVAEPSAMLLGAELIRLFAHALLGGVLGYAIGAACVRDPDGDRRGHVAARFVTLRLRVILGYALAVVIHTGWNGFAYVHASADANRHHLLALMALLMMMWGLMVSIASRQSAALFAAPADRSPGV